MKAEKKIDLNRMYREIGDLYRAHPERREEIAPLIVELAQKLGLPIRFQDDRDMFLVCDTDGRFIQSTGGFREASKIVEANPGYRYFNRTHPGCPPELRAQFDEKTGW